MTLGAITFGAPFLLIGLLALPIIWLLLKLTPPKPREEVFPPTRILEELGQREETPAKSPWWLTLLRLLMAALVIFALSEPVWNAPEQSSEGSGPMLIVMDDGWTGGNNWDVRQATARRVLNEAGSAGRPVALVFTSQEAKADLATKRVEEWTAALNAAKPNPIPVVLAPLAEKLRTSSVAFETVVWLSGGLKSDDHDAFKTALESLAPSQLQVYSSQTTPVALSETRNAPDALTVSVSRASSTDASDGIVTAYDSKGRSISSAPFEFPTSGLTTTAEFKLPVELRNEVVRLEIDNATTAAGVQLLDERFRRRRVGLISGGNADQQQPLLSPLYYISRALEPFSELREASADNNIDAIKQLINERMATLVLADIGQLPKEAIEELEQWVNKGGMLIRFAGPRLARRDDGQLVPVTLRRGGRSLGGTLTWGEAKPLSSFDNNSPFKGIPVPEDVTVTRQVLAEPDIDLASKTWASLKDGTPLVTASQRGAGWIVLFHVTADAGWSNLPLSGAFVDMLRRLVAVSNNVVAADQAREAVDEQVNDVQTLAPFQSLNGFGKLSAPPSDARGLTVTNGETPPVAKENPPGLYGAEDAFVALNLFSTTSNLNRIAAADIPAEAAQLTYTTEDPTPFKPWLLGAALLFLALDCIAVLWMAGALRTGLTRGAKVASAVVLSIILLQPDTTFAQEKKDEFDFEHALRTRLAYVKTGNSRLDEVSRKGLIGLTQFIASRTSLEPDAPVGLDITKDELSFYPLLYWPVDANSEVPSQATMARIDNFMKKGGSVLFDTRDQLSGGFGSSRVSAETQKLRQILSSLDIPALEPVPNRHVLTRAFYLLNVFPGRYLEGKLWVEASQNPDEQSDRPARSGDGVSSILITSNDFASAWATESDGRPSFAIVPPNPTQRVYAYRTGVNIVMYTLTGNYKSDQVHIPALLERLGQ